MRAQMGTFSFFSELLLRDNGVAEDAEEAGGLRSQVRQEQGVAGPQRGQRYLHGQLQTHSPQTGPRRSHHQEAMCRALQVCNPTQPIMTALFFIYLFSLSSF